MRLIADARETPHTYTAGDSDRGERAPAFAVLALVVRGAIYLTIGVAVFLLVTLVAARPW
jgi:hypothetical protein